jgi:tight adherence protein C
MAVPNTQRPRGKSNGRRSGAIKTVGGNGGMVIGYRGAVSSILPSRKHRAIEDHASILGGKILSMLLFPTAALILSVGQPFNTRFLIVLLGVVAGIMGPRMGLGFIRRRFNAAIQRGTPDAIDLLVVCCEAGMGLEAGIERVTQEMQRSSPAVSRVLSGLLDDLRMLPDRRDAFNNLSNRSTCEGLRRFGTMLNQSLQYGTPLGDALRAIAEELRRDRITRLEARAHKLGAKLTIPMVIFMLPAMFVILGGGPGLDLMHSLRGIR